jgi:hypothetical protein
MHWRIIPRNKPALLWEVLNQFKSSGAHLSLEGDLEAYEVLEYPLASTQESTILKRNTISPRLDFVIIPISEPLIVHLKHHLNGAGVFTKDGGLIHVQVEMGGALVFGAYDNFHKDCTSIGGVTEQFLEHLVSAAILRSYEAA